MAQANLSIAETSAALGLDKQTLRILIRDGIVDYGKAYKLPGSKRYNYLISPQKFFEATGIRLGGLKNE